METRRAPFLVNIAQPEMIKLSGVWNPDGDEPFTATPQQLAIMMVETGIRPTTFAIPEPP